VRSYGGWVEIVGQGHIMPGGVVRVLVVGVWGE